MSQVSLKTRESDSGCFTKETIYHLRDLGQAIIFTLMNHEDQINQNTKDIEYLKEPEMFEKSRHIIPVLSTESGVVQSIDADIIGSVKIIIGGNYGFKRAS